MSFDKSADTPAPASLPIQFVHIEITPLVDGNYSVAMQATRLDAAMTIIRDNVAFLATAA